MVKHLTRKVRVGKSKPKLTEIDASISPAAWHILRWYVVIKFGIFPTEHPLGSLGRVLHISKKLYRVTNVSIIWVCHRLHPVRASAHVRLDPNWRQFRLTVGAPDAEAKFKKQVEAATKKDANAAKYPALYVRRTFISSKDCC